MSNRICELRKEKKITQLQLAMELDVTQETISSYEHGRHAPSMDVLKKMSTYFSASIDYIMGVSDIRLFEPDSQFSTKELEQRTRLMRFYSLLSPTNREKLISYAEGLYDSSAKGTKRR